MRSLLRLLKVELTRLRWRRAVLVLIAASFLIPALVWATTVWNTRPYSQSEIDQARVTAQAQPGFQREVRGCERHPHRYGAQEAADCEELMISNWSGLYREQIDVRRELQGNGPGLVTTVAILGMLIGATFVGADWVSGSMSNHLLFEPRRGRVWLAKATAVGMAMAAVGLVVQSLYWLGIYLVANARDRAPRAALLDDVLWQIGRGTCLIVLAAVVGFAITMLFRSTVFTLGLLFVIAVAGTFIVAALPLGGQNERYMIHANTGAVIAGKYTYWAEPPADCYTDRGRPDLADGETRAEWGKRCDETRTVTVWDGLTYLLVPSVLLLGLSVWTFRRRDVP